MSWRVEAKQESFLAITSGMFALKDKVIFGEYEIPFDEFFAAVEYVLTNTDLYSNDPRLDFLSKMKKAKIIEGFNEGKMRIEIGE